MLFWFFLFFFLILAFSWCWGEARLNFFQFKVISRRLQIPIEALHQNFLKLLVTAWGGLFFLVFIPSCFSKAIFFDLGLFQDVWNCSAKNQCPLKYLPQMLFMQGYVPCDFPMGVRVRWPVAVPLFKWLWCSFAEVSTGCTYVTPKLVYFAFKGSADWNKHHPEKQGFSIIIYSEEKFYLKYLERIFIFNEFN